MADDFSTPISSLGIQSSRDSNHSVQPQSYDELLRQTDAPEPVQKQVRFKEPVAEAYDDQYMDQSRPAQDYMTGPPLWPPHLQNPYAQMPPPPPPYEPSKKEEKEPEKPWWKTWITQNKIGAIVAIVVFLLMYFVYPRIASMERFVGQRLPPMIIGALAVAAASGVTAVNMAI